jgi:aryl-phospho-beta-D-glucosidase BglC (GH1 family)
MLRRRVLIFAVILCVFSAFLSIEISTMAAPVRAAQETEVLRSRFARLRHGINLSHWFAQSSTYAKEHLDTHTTAEDMALIKRLGFDHVRFTVEPAPLINPNDPGSLRTEYLRYFDAALDMILAQRLAVIVDIHPADEFKLRLKDDRQVENFVKFWRALAEHLSKRDPEMVFLETINEPMVEDPYRWYGIQAKLIAAIRAGAPKHTIIASGHRWSGLAEMLALEPYSDPNIIYNFHYYDPFPFTHQGATWAGPHLQFYSRVPYPSSPESVAKILDTIADQPARLNLVQYGQDRWNAERIDRDIRMAAEWGANHQVPVTCNEFGAYRRVSNPEDRARWIADMRIVLERHGIGWTMWDYAGGFSVVNKTNGHPTPDLETVKALGLGG